VDEKGARMEKENLIKKTRLSMGLSQAAFGCWLAAKTGRATPYPPARISDWERGKVRPRKNIEKACFTVMAVVTRYGRK